MDTESTELKTKQIVIGSTHFLLVLCASFCVLGILISAFSFDVSMSRLFLVVLVSSAVVVPLAETMRSVGLLIAALPAGVLFFWNIPSITQGFRLVLFSVTALFEEWTPIPVLYGDEVTLLIEPTIFFSFLGIGLVFLLGVSVCMLRSGLLTLLSTLPLVLLSFVLVTTQPQPIYLLGLLAVYLTLFFSSNLYAQEEGDPDTPDNAGIPLIMPVLFFFVVLLFSLYTVIPPAQYQRSDNARRMRTYIIETVNKISSMFKDTPNVADGGVSNGWFSTFGDDKWVFNTEAVDITGAKRRVITNQSLLEITVSTPGTFYLRGFSMGEFNGKEWMQDGSFTDDVSADSAIYNYYAVVPLRRPAEIFILNKTIDHNSFEEVLRTFLSTIETLSIQRINDNTAVDYTPYYSTSDDFHIYNPEVPDVTIIQDLQHENGLMFIYLSDSSILDYFTPDVQSVLPGMQIGDIINTVYTSIDNDTAQGLRQLALDAGIDPNAGREIVVDTVAAYVSSSGRYSLVPPVIPEDADFAQYFLEFSEQGYCIHYATAATLMLRALNIPARFTCGYVVSVSDDSVGHTVVLTDKNAHAWVEVFYDGIGWVPLEVTPSNTEAAIPERRPHTPGMQGEITPFPTPPGDDEDSDETSTVTGQGSGGTGQGGDSSSSTGMVSSSCFTNALIVICSIAVLTAVLHIRRILLKTYRKRRFMGSDTNAAVIFMWKYASALYSNHEILPTDINQLAQKARFSQHRITQEERDYMVSYVHRLATELYNGKGDYGRLWFKYIRALV